MAGLREFVVQFGTEAQCIEHLAGLRWPGGFACAGCGGRQAGRLAATRAAWLGLPRRNRCFREPDGQAPALAQGNVISSPIRHSVPLLRDMMTAVLVGVEWHGGCPGSETGP